MSLKSSAKSSAAPAAMGVRAPQSSALASEAGLAGDSVSEAALARLDTAIAELKALSVAPLLQRALKALRAEDAKAGSEWALKALNQDERSGMAWYILAVAREKAGDFTNSLSAYQSALALLPDHAQVANDLGRLAYRMGMKDVAEALFRRFLDAHPDSYEAANNLACAVRDQGRIAEAIDILKPAIKAAPEAALLWNTLGTLVSEQGDLASAITFFNEALRCNSTFAKARYNRGNAWMDLGELAPALADCDTAITQTVAPEEKAMMRLARATIMLALGRIGDGWDDYEARLDPQLADSTHFLVDYPAWTPATDLAGKRLLLMAEQGLGDEVLFASLLPDVLRALGPRGQLMLAVEPRLVSLFQRSFPTVEVAPHATYSVGGLTVRGAAAFENRDDIELWAPIASLLRRYRRRVEDFPACNAYLGPDPARVEHWRRALAEAGDGIKVGLLWKSMKLDANRARHFSPFHLWAPVLTTPGARFVNIQYGDCDAEVAWAAQELGIPIWTPPGVDLKNDLDDIAALAVALDLTIGFANATSNIAAATGAPTWIISAPSAWTRLGTDRMPWYPQARVFLPPGLGHWQETMAAVAAALAAAARV